MRFSRKQLLPASIVLISFAVIAFISVRSNSLKPDDRDPDSLLKKADDLSWNNNWIRAEPLYHRAELLYTQQHRPSQALYAHVSQIPPNAESSSLTATIFGLTEDLARPEAADPETRLRILTIRGMLEVNYDAASSRSTWTQVAELARRQNHYQLAVRAVGEQGISAFLLGDIGAAKKDVLEAWTIAKVLHDPAASVRYASVYGAGLVDSAITKPSIPLMKPSKSRRRIQMSEALAITKTSVRPYTLPAQATLEADASRYRHELRSQGVDPALGQKLFNELLGPIEELHEKSHLILIPDGSLHLLPFSALVDHNQYLLQTHEVSVTPSSTVLHILRTRARARNEQSLPYVGVAAWNQTADTRNFITRSISGPQRSELTPLPDSQREVQSIGTTLPKPSTILLGEDATKTHFESLPLNRFNVLHLALHGYADIDYPDRSALVFAPKPSASDDGLLQVRDIRKMHLNAKLVTLSACNTGVGPVGEAGVANLVNAFIEAGAESVVSTLWELEDHSTSRLMTDFYHHVAMHEPEAQALRDAQLQLINEKDPPYFWGAFSSSATQTPRFNPSP